ncbi:MAG TPA: hypothetical protein VE891_13945 [Allosphingosinicella sp.]|nr:hypothetical protein [Allosphingosinicella sp.]
MQTVEQSIAIDAEWYARSQGVTKEEAIRRLRIQREMGDVIDRMRSQYQGRLAGIVIEHKPAYRLKLRLTGSEAVAAQSVSLGGSTLPIAFEIGAPATVDALVASIQSNLPALKTLFPTLDGIGTDESTSQIVLTVYAPDAVTATAAKAKEAQVAELLKLPFRIETTTVREVLADVRGGARIAASGGGYCTTGFVVKNTSGTTGVATAGHCEGMDTYYNPSGTTIPTTIVASSEIVDADQDVEVHTSGYVERPEFYADTTDSARVLTGRRYKTSTGFGDNVCHRGVRTLYSCGLVKQTNYTPLDSAGNPARCGAVACGPYYVRVEGPELACYQGDSGGPVFASTVAFGLLKTAAATGTLPGQCIRMTYMSTDSLPTGWSLLYGP